MSSPDVGALAASVREAQQRLAAALDVALPPDAFGWDEAKIRAHRENPTTCAPGRPTILLLGDSLTDFGSHSGGAAPAAPLQSAGSFLGYADARAGTKGVEEHGPGWAALLARDYQWGWRADVANRGYAGYNTRWYLERALPPILASVRGRPVAAVTLMLGSNDMVRPPDPQCVPLEQYASNLRALVEAVRSALPDTPILLITPPPCDGDKWKQWCLRTSGGTYDGNGRSVEAIAPYAAEMKAIGAALGESQRVHVLDLHAAVLATDGWAAMMYDGLHFTAEGNALVYGHVSKALADLGLAPASMQREMPAHLHLSFPQMFDVDAVPAAPFGK